MNMTITTIIARMASLQHQAADIIAALDVHMVNEDDHSRRGRLARLRTTLLDFRDGLKNAKAPFSGAGRIAKIRTVIAAT